MLFHCFLSSSVADNNSDVNRLLFHLQVNFIFLSGSLSDFCFFIHSGILPGHTHGHVFLHQSSLELWESFQSPDSGVSSAEEECSFIIHLKIIASPVFPFALGIHIISHGMSPQSSLESHLFSYLFTSLLALCSESFAHVLPSQ